MQIMLARPGAVLSVGASPIVEGPHGGAISFGRMFTEPGLVPDACDREVAVVVKLNGAGSVRESATDLLRAVR